MEVRMWYILAILKITELEYISASDIQWALLEKYDIDCNIKTIYSDIKKINMFMEQFMQIENYIKVKRKFGYYIEYGCFDDAMLRFLYDAIISSDAIGQQEAKRVFDLVRVFSPNQQLKRLGIEKLEKLSGEDQFVKMNTILMAIHQKKAILFEYNRYRYDGHQPIPMLTKGTNGNYDRYTYYISPYEVMMQAGHYYLLAYNDSRREQLSIYRIDRMEKVRTTKSPYIDIKEMWDMEILKKRAINMFFSTETIDLKFLFSTDVFGGMIDQFGDKLRVQSDISGKCLGEVKDVTLSDGLIAWVMMWGNKLTILEPISLKEKVIQRIEESLSQYTNNPSEG